MKRNFSVIAVLAALALAPFVIRDMRGQGINNGGGSGGSLTPGAANAYTVSLNDAGYGSIGTRFSAVSGFEFATGASEGTEANVSQRVSTATTFGPLSMGVSVAPGSGKSITVTARLTPIATGTPGSTTLTCTISDTATACSDTTTGHYFTAAAGDLVDYLYATSGSPAGNVNITVALSQAGVVGPTGATGANGTGNNTLCSDATGSTTTYTCPAPNPTVTSLTGLLISFIPQTTNSGSSTVNVAGLGAKTLKQSDCSTNLSASALTGGSTYLFAYNGTVFCQGSGGTSLSGTGLVRQTGVATELSQDAVTSGSNATTVQGVNGTPLSTNLAVPISPTITQSGSAGSSPWSYAVVAKFNSGLSYTQVGLTGSTATGNATLTGSNYNIVTTPSVTGSTSCDVYRLLAATSPSTLGKIGNVACGSALNDTGLAGDGATAPATNSTILSTTNVNAIGSTAGWGDSLTAGTGGTAWPTQLGTISSLNTYNGGNGGDTCSQISTRYLADTVHNKWLTVFWAGRNDIGVNSNPTILSCIATMVANVPSPQQFLVLAVLNIDATECTGTTNYIQVAALNASLAAAYPNNYLDIRTELVNAWNPSLAGDVTTHTCDAPAASLVSGGVHLNTAGYLFVAQQVYTWTKTHLNYTLPVSVGQLLALLSAPPIVGNGPGAATTINATTFNVIGSDASVHAITMAGNNTSLQMGMSPIPSSDGGFDLGFSTSNLRWNNGYFKNTVYSTVFTGVNGGSAPTVNAASCTGAAIGANSTATSGSVTGLPTGSCSVVITFSSATAAHGRACFASDTTTPANLFAQSSAPTSSTNSVTFAGTSVSGDVLAYGCLTY